MQKEASGKEIIFVPSGGKGSDEVIAEAEAIGNYLQSQGIPEEQILVENQSANTFENIRNSMELIKEDYDKKRTGNPAGADDSADAGEPADTDTLSEPKVAFSTTNYHVFRAGLIASDQGFQMEGIGSPTKRYFWLNAFVREFIATLVSERKRHIKMIIYMFLGVFLMTLLNFISILL